MHKTVEKNSYKWFGFLLLLGGECGAKNGKNNSSINELTRKVGPNGNKLEKYNYFTRWLIKRAMQRYKEFALHFAAAKGDLQEMEMLIANSYDVNERNEEQKTPLHAAFELPSVDTLRILIESGANVNAQNRDGKTPLHLAFEKKDLDCFKFLLVKGADVTAKDNEGRTPLHYASEEGKLDFATLWWRKMLEN
jgi:hypothetical protein